MTQDMIAPAAAAPHALGRTVAAPLATRHSESRTVHGDTAVTSYGWMRDQHSPETVAHLVAENAYTRINAPRTSTADARHSCGR